MPNNNLLANFIPLKLSDLSLLRSFLRRFPHPVVGFTAATMVIWNDVFRYSFWFPDSDSLLVTFHIDGRSELNFMQPIGNLSTAVTESLLALAQNISDKMRFFGVSQEFILRYPDFVRRFEIINNRNSANYIYRTSDLAHLKARKYSKKRNLLNQAGREYSWQVENLTAVNISDCHKVLEKIFGEADFEMKNSLVSETKALGFALSNYSNLNQNGLLFRIEGEPVGFSIFEEQTPSTAVIHFEKAVHSFKGLFQVINRETALRIEALGYQYINREEDLGDPGLRQSKLSYYPCEIRPSLILTYKRKEASRQQPANAE